MLVSADFGTPSVLGGGFLSAWNIFAALVGLAFLSEAVALRERVGTVTSSVAFVAYLAAVLMLGPAWAMLIGGTTELLAETIVRRKPAANILINTSKEVVAVGGAGYMYLFAGGLPSVEQFSINLPAFVAAALTYFLLGNGAVATAVGLAQLETTGEAWHKIVFKGLHENVLSSSVAVLLAFLYIELQLIGLLIVVIPLFFVRALYRSNLELERTNRELLDLMVKAIEARDPYTSGHSIRVAAYAKALARALGLSPKEIEQIDTAALLHDVGKIYDEFASILRKPGRLTDGESAVMQSHPVRSAELVATISSLQGYVAKCVRAHHEHFDGSGYPDGLAGRAIPIGARIIMVADTADAMMTDRPYRRALSYEQVIDEFEGCAGTQFDPEVVNVFRRSTAIRRLVEERAAIAGQLTAPALQSVAGSAPPVIATSPARGKWRHAERMRS
jgi:putative nucleotidyltransferase with HDIG domain